jgi:sugar lactone lactonase YvrE
MKKVFLGLVALLAVWLLWPAPIDGVAWQPQENPGLTGDYALNDKLKSAEILPLADGFGPEDIAVDAEGRIYGGLHDGRIIRLKADGSGQETFATIDGGRPLGMAFDKAGNLIVADSYKGLLSVAPNGDFTVLTAGHGGRPFMFTDDVDIAADGKIYFSDASDTYSQPDYMLDLMEARGHGRLMVYDPATGETDMLLDNLYFANGIAVSENQDFVLVNETGRYRITRYWLTGDKAGSHDVFVDNLPGFPDGISRGANGIFWLAIPSPRNPVLDDAHPNPWLKGFLLKLPKFIAPGAIKQGVVVALNEQGEVQQVLHDPDGALVYMVTSVEQVGDQIYLGSLEAPQIVRMKVSAPK